MLLVTMVDVPFNQIRTYLINLTNKCGYTYWNGHLRSKLKWLRDVEKINLIKKNSQRDMKVLDLGCGFGHMTLMIKEIGLEVIGIDVQKKNFTILKELDAPFLLCDGLALPFKSKIFDLILANGVLEHVGKEDEEKILLQESCRVLKKKGIFYISALPRKYSFEHIASKLSIRSHTRYFDIKMVRTIIENAGFNIVQIENEQLVILNILPFWISNSLAVGLLALEKKFKMFQLGLYETYGILTFKRKN